MHRSLSLIICFASLRRADTCTHELCSIHHPCIHTYRVIWWRKFRYRGRQMDPESNIMPTWANEICSCGHTHRGQLANAESCMKFGEVTNTYRRWLYVMKTWSMSHCCSSSSWLDLIKLHSCSWFTCLCASRCFISWPLRDDLPRILRML